MISFILVILSIQKVENRNDLVYFKCENATYIPGLISMDFPPSKSSLLFLQVLCLCLVIFSQVLPRNTVNFPTFSCKNTAVAPVVVEEPEFTEIIENITVPAGRNVKLACSVKNLGSYKVAWMHFEQSAILTVHNHVITRNPRITVTHDKYDKHRTWFLHINDVKEEDKGRYMCQINTVTAKTQFGYLHVVVPPNIDDSLSSSDIIVREGANITLKCKATGSPLPSVKWKRDDNSKIAINKSLIVSEWDGEVLEVSRISRLDMGSYLCIASNGVPPSVSKRIKVSVDFPPMMMIPHQLVGAAPRTNVTLECLTEAHPTSLNYWTKEDGNMIHDSRKYKSESIVGHPTYKTTMRLTITNVDEEDENSYKCVAKNPRGESEGTIRLYLSPPLASGSSSTTTTTSPALNGAGAGGEADEDWDSTNEIYVRYNKSLLFKQNHQDEKYGRNAKKLDKFEHQNSIGHNGKGFSKYPLGNFDANSGGSSGRNVTAILLLLVSAVVSISAYRQRGTKWVALLSGHKPGYVVN